MTVIRTRRDALRIAFNRDELITRPPACAPSCQRLSLAHAAVPLQWHRLQSRCLMPVDPRSGGTWIAVNGSGLVLAILNVNQPGSNTIGVVSRGRIIPSLLDQADAIDAMRVATLRLPFSELAPFRLIALDRHTCAVLRFDGIRSTVCVDPIDRPLMFTSSGLGDVLVEHPRRELFEELVAPDPTPQSQDAFHGHTWPDRPQLSVNMSREDARTVSCTTIEIDDRSARMEYRDVLQEVFTCGRSPRG